MNHRGDHIYLILVLDTRDLGGKLFILRVHEYIPVYAPIAPVGLAVPSNPELVLEFESHGWSKFEFIHKNEKTLSTAGSK